jgi:hypothetical protein
MLITGFVIFSAAKSFARENLWRCRTISVGIT